MMLMMMVDIHVLSTWADKGQLNTASFSSYYGLGNEGNNERTCVLASELTDQSQRVNVLILIIYCVWILIRPYVGQWIRGKNQW